MPYLQARRQAGKGMPSGAAKHNKRLLASCLKKLQPGQRPCLLASKILVDLPYLQAAIMQGRMAELSWPWSSRSVQSRSDYSKKHARQHSMMQTNPRQHRSLLFEELTQSSTWSTLACTETSARMLLLCTMSCCSTLTPPGPESTHAAGVSSVGVSSRLAQSRSAIGGIPCPRKSKGLTFPSCSYSARHRARARASVPLNRSAMFAAKQLLP